MPALEPERHAPILINPHGPVAFQVTFERMQFPAGHIHVFQHLGGIQFGQLQSQPFGMNRLNAGLTAGREKGFEALVLEGFDHNCDCIAWLYGLQAGWPNSAGDTLLGPECVDKGQRHLFLRIYSPCPIY